MRKTRIALIVACVLIVFMVTVAAQNQLGVADTYRVNFVEKVRVADTLLPKGNYEIRHVMEGQDHIMVFRQLGTVKPLEVRAKCTLVPLEGKAASNQTIYNLNEAQERVLKEMIFKGDTAKHVF